MRFAAEAYTADPEHFAREAMHVTNTVRFQDHPDLVVADDVADDGTGNVWSLEALIRRLANDSAESPLPALEKLAAGLMAAIEVAGVLPIRRRFRATRRRLSCSASTCCSTVPDAPGCSKSSAIRPSVAALR
ncbi:MAG: hypothetical protein VCD33_00150, partial [Alphaproteobacteria bacterium]